MWEKSLLVLVHAAWLLFSNPAFFSNAENYAFAQLFLINFTAFLQNWSSQPCSGYVIKHPSIRFPSRSELAAGLPRPPSRPQLIVGDVNGPVRRYNPSRVSRLIPGVSHTFDVPPKTTVGGVLAGCVISKPPKPNVLQLPAAPRYSVREGHVQGRC